MQPNEEVVRRMAVRAYRLVWSRRASSACAGLLLTCVAACTGTGTPREGADAATTTVGANGPASQRPSGRYSSQPTSSQQTSALATATTSTPGPATAHPTSSSGAETRRPTGWGPTEGEWAAAQRSAARLTDQELAGQVIVARYAGTQPPTSLVSQYHLGGVIVMGDNVRSVEQVESSNAALQTAAGAEHPWPLVLAVDQEGGTVARLGAPMTDFPALMAQGAAGSYPLARAVAAASGEELRAVGFTMVFAPDADVTIGPSDPTIGSRSAGGRASRVARIVTAATAGYRSAGVVSVLKHFPGHGSVTSNSHETLPVQPATLEQLRRRDFVPFARAIDSGAPAVMVGHLALADVDPGVPADLSAPDVEVLRSELGFRGLVTTDALEMAAVTDQYTPDNAAVAALRAGVDLLLMPANTDEAYHGILAGLQDGSLSRARLEDAAAKIIALMMHEGTEQPVSTDVIGSHRALSQRLSGAAATILQGSCAGPYVGSSVTPVGDLDAVRRFDRAAQRAGLRVGGGKTVALLGFGAQGQSADVVVSLDTPYVLGYSTASTAKIAMFGSGEAAMRALVDVLTGKSMARGRLPVAVQGVDPPRC